MDDLSKKGILGGLPLAGNQILWCCTEMNSKTDIDELISVLRDEVQR
jgi:glycine dehydrogenase subunit 1